MFKNEAEGNGSDQNVKLEGNQLIDKLEKFKYFKLVLKENNKKYSK